MQILIWSLDGEVHQLEVTPSDTIHSIKKELDRRHGVDTTQQRLVFAGVECLNEQTLAARHIVEGSTLHLVVTVTALLQVQVELQNGRVFDTYIDPSDTVATIKAQIQADVFPGVVLLEHQLFSGDQLLQEDAIMASYKIPEGAILRLEEAGTTDLSIVWPNRKTSTVKIGEYRGQATLHSLLWSTCRSDYGVTPKLEDLQVCYNGRSLELSSMVGKCGFKSGDSIHVYTSAMTIQFKTRSKLIELPTHPFDTVGDLLTLFYEETGELLNLYVINLSIAGEVLERGQPLCKYGIHTGDQINMNMRPPIELNIVTSGGNSNPVKIKPSATIAHLRMKIEDLFENEECAEESSGFILKHDDTMLSSDRQVCYYGLLDGGEIKLIYPCKVFIRATTRKRYVVKALANDTVIVMKEALFRQTSINPSHQILLDGKTDQILNDDISLCEYNIQDGDELMLQTEVKFHVIDNKDRKHELIMKPSARIEEIKSSLEQMTGIRSQDQVLFYQNLEFQDDQIVGQCEILVRGGSINMAIREFKLRVNTGENTPVEVSIQQLITIRTLKTMLEAHCQFNADEMFLYLGDVELLDERTLWESEIRDSEIEISLFIIPPVQVKLPNGRVISISVKQGDKMRVIMEELERIGWSRKGWMLCRGEDEVADDEVAGQHRTAAAEVAAMKATTSEVCVLELRVRTIGILWGWKRWLGQYQQVKVTETVREGADRDFPNWDQYYGGGLYLDAAHTRQLDLDLTWLQQDITQDTDVYLG